MANLLENKRARFNYELMNEYEAGLDLRGFEVKALRNKMGSLEGSHITVRGDEAFVVGMQVPLYQPANTPTDYEPERVRKILLHKKEIAELGEVEQKRGLTIVPISVYNKGRHLKLRLAVARGKKKYDKRQVIKAREDKRKIERTLKKQY